MRRLCSLFTAKAMLFSAHDAANKGSNLRKRSIYRNNCGTNGAALRKAGIEALMPPVDARASTQGAPRQIERDRTAAFSSRSPADGSRSSDVRPHPRGNGPFVRANHINVDRRGFQRSVSHPALKQGQRYARPDGMDRALRRPVGSFEPPSPAKEENTAYAALSPSWRLASNRNQVRRSVSSMKVSSSPAVPESS